MNDNIFDNSILIIGGMSIGKTTISELLSMKLNMPLISTDAWKDEYLKNISSYSFEKQLEIRKSRGYVYEMQYLIPYLNMSLINLLENLDTPSIIDIGALNTFDLNSNLFNKLKKFKNIILLQSKNIKSILKRRKIDINSDLGKIYVETLLNPNNVLLSTHDICVDNKAEQEIVSEIVKKVTQNKNLK